MFRTPLLLRARGQDIFQDTLFSYGSMEQRIPKGHPLRPIRVTVDEVLRKLGSHFADLHSPKGRRSVPPQKLLRALLVMVLYSIRSERRLMEELEYNLLYRWFVGMGQNEPVWDATTFSRIGNGSSMAKWHGCSSMRR